MLQDGSDANFLLGPASMATLRQIQANRNNAQKSTGPRTARGKAASRRNALKHGLAGAGVVMPEWADGLIQKRMDAWRPYYRLNSDQEEFTFRVMITSSIQVDLARNLEAARRNHAAARARDVWERDRYRDAVRLGAKLSRQPELILHELQSTYHGCEWLIRRWRRLQRPLEQGREWTTEQSQIAFDLLGTPAEFRDELPLESDESPRDLVAREIAALESMRDSGLADLDEHRRMFAEDGLDPEPDPEILRLMRYQLTCMSRYRWAEGVLRNNRIDPDREQEREQRPHRDDHPTQPPLPTDTPADPDITAREFTAASDPAEESRLATITNADYQRFDLELMTHLLASSRPSFLDGLTDFPEIADNLTRSTPASTPEPTPTPIPAPSPTPAPTATPAPARGYSLGDAFRSQVLPDLNRHARRALGKRARKPR